MYALSSNGTLVYAQASGDRRLVWVDRQGREEFGGMPERLYSHLRLSPDGTRIVTYQADGDRDLWLFDVSRPTTVTKLTFGPARDAMPVWSRNGTRIFFTTKEHDVSWIAADRRSDDVVTLFSGPPGARIHPLSISPDGRTLLVSWQKSSIAQIDLGILSLEPTPRLTPLLAAESYNEADGRLSPDGRWLAYQSDESGKDQILVRPFPNVTTSRRVISAGFGQQPIWSQNGREIFYRTEDGTVMAVPVRTMPSFDHGTPIRVVTAPQTLRTGMGPTYDVSPDGSRFVMIRAPELDIRSLTVVQNWDVEVQATISKAGRE